MALTRNTRGTGTGNTAATTLAVVPGSNLTAGALAVLRLAVDNAHTGGTAMTITVSDTKSNTWTVQQHPLVDPGNASAGAEGIIATTPQNGGALTTGDTITVSFGSDTPTAKAWALSEVIAAAGNAPVVIAGNIGTSGTGTTSPTITTTSIASGDMVLAMVAVEAGTTETFTDDADTSNGSWTASQKTSIGSTTSGMAIHVQDKITTGAGTQTYNPTLGILGDLALAWIEVQEKPARTLSAALTGGGVYGASSKKTASSSPTETGGGVYVNASLAARIRGAAAAVGGGVLALTKTTARARGATAATGGGVEGPSAKKTALSSPAETGGGVLVVSAKKTASGSTSETGGGIVAPVGAKTALVSPAETGGGIVVVDAVASSIVNRDASFSATGGGVLSPARASAREGTAATTGGGVAGVLVLTSRETSSTAVGGGVANVLAIAGRSTSIAETGAGVLVFDSSSGRASVLSPTGGGVAHITTPGTQLEEGSFASTAGGSATLDVATDRTVDLVGSGGGVFTLGGGPLIVTVGGGTSSGTSATGGTSSGTTIGSTSRGTVIIGGDSEA